MRAALFVLAALGASSCRIGSSTLALSVPSERLIADGATQASVGVCNQSEYPSDRVSVTLRTTTGVWLNASGDEKKSIKVQLTPGALCATEAWVPPVKAGSVRFEALLDNEVLASGDVAVGPAEISGIQLLAEPSALNDGAATAGTIGVRFITAKGGTATDGTSARLRIAESVPPNTAALDDEFIVAGQNSSLKLITTDATTAIRLEAEVVGAASITACRVLSPLGVTPALSCP